MHLLSASCVCALLFAALLRQVRGSPVIGLYGETVIIPCNSGNIKAETILMTKWKYEKNGHSGDLLVRNKQDTTFTGTDEYKNRVSMDKNSSLLLSGVKLSDQGTFTCMVATLRDITEYPSNLVVNKQPAGLEISDKAKELEIGKRTKLGTCVARDANPPANITWLRNKTPLAYDGKGISVIESVVKDPATGLSTTTSTLDYSAKKEDSDAEFTCMTRGGLVSSPVTVTITYSTENIALKVIAPSPLVEGNSMTLKCVADGNPAPTSFNFHLKGQLQKVENANTYTIVNVSRDNTGEYKCSLTDVPSMEASKNITVNYLDVSLTPSGSIVRRAGEALDLTLKIDSSAKAEVSWTKRGAKLDAEPKFAKLTFLDADVYECEVTMRNVNLSRKASFTLVVEGAPVIRQLSQQHGEDGQHEVLICEAEGSPKPAVSWNINGTLSETRFENGKITQKIMVVPSTNLTVSCTVSNEFGTDSKDIVVSSLNKAVIIDKQDSSDDNDQTKLVVGVVVGLLVATLVIGLAYWVYMKKSKQGSWKTGEKENGSSEEEKKLEEKVDENSQKAEV